MPKFKLNVNGKEKVVEALPVKRLADVLRNDLNMTGTKVGCDAGDCGACTVILDGNQICSCLVPLAQADGRNVLTIEGLSNDGDLNALQKAFHRHGAAQCGICTPAMLMAATELLKKYSSPTKQQICDALGGVLCRCTGYKKIIDAILQVNASSSMTITHPEAGEAVGARVVKLDG